MVLGSLALWVTRARCRRTVTDMPPAQRHRWIHGSLGVTLAVGLIFLSVTGLTWSPAAGGRIVAACASHLASSRLLSA
ncbi:hypothetical protein [Paracoccus sp. (in: a-proteobacteria)]|uniref:hypothetical protein n=1 Tax=Paracoccus sp. TaxID=267 RepID=UPI00396CD07C